MRNCTRDEEHSDRKGEDMEHHKWVPFTARTSPLRKMVVPINALKVSKSCVAGSGVLGQGGEEKEPPRHAVPLLRITPLSQRAHARTSGRCSESNMLRHGRGRL